MSKNKRKEKKRSIVTGDDAWKHFTDWLKTNGVVFIKNPICDTMFGPHLDNGAPAYKIYLAGMEDFHVLVFTNGKIELHAD